MLTIKCTIQFKDVFKAISSYFHLITDSRLSLELNLAFISSLKSQVFFVVTFSVQLSLVNAIF